MENNNRGTISNINISIIDDPVSPMRTDIEMDEIKALGDSIKTVGLINPITVRPRHLSTCAKFSNHTDVSTLCVCKDALRYEVVAGHRRLLACRLVNYSPIPCVIKELDDDAVVGIMAIENLDRENVDPVDEALFIAKYVGDDDSKVAELSIKIHRSIQWIRDRLDILTYSELLISSIKLGKISLGVAKWLGRIDNERIQNLFVNSALMNPMTVLQAEYQYNIWKTGALDNVDNPVPVVSDLPPQEQSRAKATCARCGRLAIDPNLHSVFVHMECPVDELVA